MQTLLNLTELEEKAADLVVRAKKHIIPFEMLQAVTNAEKTPPEYRRILDALVVQQDNYQFCFSFEVQSQGLYRHFSISTKDGGAPHPVLVDQVLPMFGMVTIGEMQRGRDLLFVETTPDGRKAVNILQADRQEGF